jgi:hypothetical protein
MLQISRGHISSIDQLDPNGGVRRTAVSAAYTKQYEDGAWQTIFAWGRHGGRYRENVMGFLAESSLRVATRHTVFGRLDQVAGGDLLRENESAQRQSLKGTRLTLGYFYDVRAGSPLGVDVGGMVSQYAGPQNGAPSNGASPVTYWMFVRFKLN